MGVGYSNITGNELMTWIAKDAGIFQKNGLDVDLQLVAGGSKTMGALIANEFQVAHLGGSETLSATSQGVDLVVVATLGAVYPYKFEVAKDIKTAADLKGKKVGVASIGGSADIATRVVLRRLGLDPEKDVSIVSLSDSQTRSTAMLGGAVQAGMDSPPGTLRLEAAGMHPLVDLAAEQLPAANNTVVGPRAWITSNHDTVQKYIDSLIQGTVRARQDRAYSISLLKKYYKDDDDQRMSEAYDFYTREVSVALPYPKAEQFKDALATLAVSNEKLRGFDVSKILDDSFVKSAAQRSLDKG
jgi:NitT/TauT family transport system substrate-binding protein